MTFPTIPAAWELSPFVKNIPVTSADDVLSLMPSWLRSGRVAEAIAGALFEAYVKITSKLSAYAATANAQYAEHSDLDFAGSQEGAYRALGESDDAFRARILRDDDVITPTAMLAAIDRITSVYTTKLATYYERPDDEILLCSAASESGFYLSTSATLLKNPCVNPWRRRHVRPRSVPRMGLLWEHRTEAYDTAIAVPADGAPRWRAHDEALRGDSTRGVVVCLPAFGNKLPATPAADDSYIFASSTRATGETFLFPHASIATQSGLGRDIGQNVYSSSSSIDSVVSAVRSLYQRRGIFAVQLQIAIDPAI